MADQISQVSLAPRRLRLGQRLPGGWTLAALAITAAVLLPILSVLWLALHPSENIWPHLLATILPRYMGTTALLMAGVAGISVAVGTGAAWLIAMYRFPLARHLDWMLLMPLAVPGYLGAYALVDFLEYAGPVQTGLREIFGWSTSRDYWFPPVRSLGSAIFVLSMALYPYVYLLARSAFREQSGCSFEVARTLGAGPLRRFFSVGLPLARPAIAAGAAIAMMETVNDFGTVDYFAVQTLTTGIFTTWLEARNAGGAAQIACVVLGLVLMLVALERASRRRGRVHRLGRHGRPVEQTLLRGPAGWLAAAACLVPVLFGFALPTGVLFGHALTRPELWLGDDLARAFFNTVTVAGSAAVLTVLAALLLVYGARLSASSLPRRLIPLTSIGYAAPGAVLGVGLLIPLAGFDNWLADRVLALTGSDPGLLLTGGSAAIVYAYVVRFFAIGQGAVDAAFGRVSPSLPMAARALGQTAGGALRRVYVPIIRGSVATALLLVFVDGVKELPATLLLRPFNFNTLATRAHEQASLEKIAEAAPPGLLVIAVGLVAVAVLARTTAHRRA